MAWSTQESGMQRGRVAMTKVTQNTQNKTAEIQQDLPSPMREFWMHLKENKGAMLGLTIISLLVFVAIFAPLIAPHDPIKDIYDVSPPVWMEDGSWQFILGTDDSGRDLLSRLIYGTRITLLVGIMVVAMALSIGVTLGMFAGYFGSWLETIIMRFTDILMAIPSLLLAIVIVAILGPNLQNAMIAIAISLIPQFIRITRASFLSEKNKDYVQASAVAGAGPFRQMFLNILPNCLPPIIVQATLSFSNAILDAAALGFLGLGARAPLAEWGTMLSNSKDYITTGLYWWFFLFPGLCILISVISFNLLGDGLRDALDPKLKK